MTSDNRAMEIVKHARVTLHYRLSLASGKEVETTRESEPVTLVVGSGDLLPAFEERLIGMTSGERSLLTVPAAEAYGLAAEDLHVLPRSEFPPELRLEPGVVIGFDAPDGEEIPGVVREVGTHEITVDFSHPLAGHDLVFDVEILRVEPPH
jgi:FKBP-type peptidyl-prolyl cis-trans isomerase SlpA